MVGFFFCRQRFLEVIPERPCSESLVEVSNNGSASGDLQGFDMFVIYLFVLYITESHLVVVGKVKVHVEKFLADFGLTIGESFRSVMTFVD